MLLYPVETIKVLAQQGGQGALSTIKTLVHRNTYAGALLILFRGATHSVVGSITVLKQSLIERRPDLRCRNPGTCPTGARPQNTWCSQPRSRPAFHEHLP